MKSTVIRHLKPVFRRGLKFAHDRGIMSRLNRLRPDRLTVLAYHRIADPDSDDFVTFAGNVSAKLEDFEWQLDFLKQNFDVISEGDLLRYMNGVGDLPRYPLLITFDDGYRDNFETARPALKIRNLPAIIFLATRCIGATDPFFWDLAAYAFRKTQRTTAVLPLIGQSQWSTHQAMNALLGRWLAQVKSIPFDDIDSVCKDLLKTLEVDLDNRDFATLHMNWNQVRQLIEDGITVGAHTIEHTILSRVSDERATLEISGSKAHIEKETNRPVRSFAFPNGLAGDYHAGHADILSEQKFDIAFSLDGKSQKIRGLGQRRFTLSRICINGTDHRARFVAKVCCL